MNITPFNFEEYEIRTLVQDGEPWFVGKDVALALGYSDPSRALFDHVDKEDKKSTLVKHQSASGSSKTTIINESGLYSLILRSKLESAKKFKRWVTSKVLPQIRKTGSYTLPQSYSEALRLAADEVEKREEAERRLEAAQPAIEFVHTAVETAGTFSFDQAAKMLGLKTPDGRVIGRNLLIKGLHQMGILMKRGSHNIPKQEHVNAGRFEVKYSIYVDGDREFSTPSTRVTSKGVYWIRERCIGAGCRAVGELELLG